MRRRGSTQLHWRDAEFVRRTLEDWLTGNGRRRGTVDRSRIRDWVHGHFDQVDIDAMRLNRKLVLGGNGEVRTLRLF